MTYRTKALLLWAATLAAFVYAAILPFTKEVPAVSVHHLGHGAMMFVGGIWGVVLARRQAPARGKVSFLVGALLTNTVANALMVFDAFSWLDLHPAAHISLHLVLLVFALVSAYLGERYAPKSGPIWVGAVVLMSLVAATGFGAAPPR